MRLCSECHHMATCWVMRTWFNLTGIMTWSAGVMVDDVKLMSSALEYLYGFGQFCGKWEEMKEGVNYDIR